MKPAFIEGAMKKVPKEVAEAIWDRMVTFGRYGFSVIHAVEYAHITYACMFLKYHYPLEWWAAVLTNAEEKEITGKFWPYVKDMVSPPDINLSGDTMVVDYANNKIRAKLGVIRGIGEATIKPIVENRPYKDIQDFVNKEVAGPSLEKLKMYEDAVEVKKFQDKAKEAAAKGKKMRVLQPKEGQVSEGYTDLHPLQDAAMKKSVLPSLPIRLHDLGKKHSKLLVSKNPPTVISTRGYETKLIDGEMLERLDQIPGESVTEDRYIAATCFVVEAKEFSYAKNTKTALKLILDADGYVSEKVLWPDYESGQLNYPESLKKGVIATVFFRKKAGRKDMSITSVAVET
jgi:DNA polymerase-3 subunit alpha